MNGKVVVGDRRRPAATAPPRRGSPAAADPAGLRVAGDRVDAAEEQVLRRASARPRSRVLEPRQRGLVDARLGLDRAVLEVDPRGGDRVLGASPSSTTSRMIDWRIAERIRFEPPLPSPSSSSPSAGRAVGDIIDGSRAPGGRDVEAERVQVLLAEHVVDVDAGARARSARAGAVRAGDARRAALGVDRGDVGRRAEAVRGPSPRGTRSPRPPGARPRRARGVEEASREAVLVEAADELLACASPAPPPSQDDASRSVRAGRSRSASARRSGCRPSEGGGLVSDLAAAEPALTGSRSTGS